MLTDVTNVMSNLNCGSAMTRKACTETNKHLKAELVEDLPKVRADLLTFMERRGGLRKALRQVRAENAKPAGCRGKATVACKTLVDFFFGGGVIEQLKTARQKASKVAKPFYKDGRAFNG